MRYASRSWGAFAAATALWLLACSSSSDQPLERLPPPPAASRLWPPPLPPPPPPPPSVTAQPPPVQIATFLREHADDQAPWRAVVYELAAKRGGGSAGFRGYKIVRQRAVADADAAALASRLGRNDSYVDGDVGCFTDRSHGYRLVRGAAALELMVNCAHVSFDGADWHAAILSPAMNEFLDRLARAPN